MGVIREDYERKILEIDSADFVEYFGHKANRIAMVQHIQFGYQLKVVRTLPKEESKPTVAVASPADSAE